VVATAFQRPDEARLVDQLRSVISLVALDGDEVVGHALFSSTAAPFPALGLAPVAIKPDRQRLEIGSQLIHAGLDRSRKAGWKGVFVLGDPRYYCRFGFDRFLASGFTSRYSGPHLMALALDGDLPVTQGIIEYASAFRLFG